MLIDEYETDVVQAEVQEWFSNVADAVAAGNHEDLHALIDAAHTYMEEKFDELYTEEQKALIMAHPEYLEPIHNWLGEFLHSVTAGAAATTV